MSAGVKARFDEVEGWSLEVRVGPWEVAGALVVHRRAERNPEGARFKLQGQRWGGVVWAARNAFAGGAAGRSLGLSRGGGGAAPPQPGSRQARGPGGAPHLPDLRRPD